MDCTHCEPALLDLCYGELAPAHEREVRAHITECPTCRKALSRLEAGQALARHLPDEAPPPELTERILRDAQAHLRRRGTPFERFQEFLESMARIAMTRQVAMATLSLLIVFVGLWSIPELTHRRDARSAMLVESAHDGEAGPPREVPLSSPPSAAPAKLEAESKQLGRVARGGASNAANGSRKAAAEVAAKRAEHADHLERLEKGRGNSAASNTLAQRLQPKAEAHGRQRFAPPPPPEPARPADLPSASAALDSKDELMLAAEPAARPTSAVAAAAPVADDKLAEGRSASVGSEASAQRAAKPAAPATLEDVFQAGVERYRADDYAAAAQLFARMLESSAPSAQRAAALLYLGRSERALGRCERAIRAYETLVRSYGSAQQSAAALLEGVACFDQLKDAVGAQRLLDHAASVPSLSTQAAKMVHERTASKPAEAPSGDAPPAP